jgi:hypothetical protein
MKNWYCLSSLLLTLLCLNGSAQNWEQFGYPSHHIRGFYTDTVDDVLYIMGSFARMNGDTMQSIAKYDGSNFSQVQNIGVTSCSSLPGCPYVIFTERINDTIYLSGAMDEMDSIEVNGIARLYNNHWDSLQSGLHNEFGSSSGYIADMVEFEGQLIACGGFYSIGDSVCLGTAVWAGEKWHCLPNPPLSDGSSCSNNCMAIYQGELYMGGNCHDSIENPNDVFRWNGNGWDAIGINSNMADISKMLVYKGELYVSGSMSLNAGDPGDNIARWNGTQWNSVGGGTDNGIADMKIIEDELYVVGQFAQAGTPGNSIPAKNIAKWDGEKWCGFASDFNYGIGALGYYNDTIYVGGSFSEVDGMAIDRLAKWIGGDFVDTCNTPITGIPTVGFGATVNEVNLFPNPASSQVIIAANNITIITIYNLLGVLVYEKKYASKVNGTTLNLSALGTGNYIVRVATSEKIVYKKLVLSR